MYILALFLLEFYIPCLPYEIINQSSIAYLRSCVVVLVLGRGIISLLIYGLPVMQLHRLQLPVEAPHISTIAFDTEQELLWIGDETVSMIKSEQSIFHAL